MGMTAYENLVKKELIKILAQDGYKTYAKIIRDLFDINVTEDPSVAAYMEPEKARIVLNSSLDDAQVSTIVRHEIMHEFANHHKRLLKHLAEKRGIDLDSMDEESLKEVTKELEDIIYGNSNFNIAGDYDISNTMYTEKDKQIVRSLILNGEIVKGLVTEDDHPEWVNLSLEDMYDKLDQEFKKNGGDNPPPPQPPKKDDKDRDWIPQKNKDGEGPSQPPQGGGESIKIIKGTFKNGKFYDLNGNLVTHEG